MDIKWRNYGRYSGPYYLGNQRFDAQKPYSPIDKILGVVASCEGNFDTAMGYDNTGVTWGFLQWTLTSGRLQKLLEQMAKTTHGGSNVYDYLFRQSLDQFFTLDSRGFAIRDGRFFKVEGDSSLTCINPKSKKNKQKIVDLCSGKSKGYTGEDLKKVHSSLIEIFAGAGKSPLVKNAQVKFARKEFMTALFIKRHRVLGKTATIHNLLRGEIDHPIAGLFFNLWQNNPKHTYQLFLENMKDNETLNSCFEHVWLALKESSFGNWGYNSKRVIESKGKRKPRCYRIAKGLKKFYNFDDPNSKESKFFNLIIEG